MEHINEQQRRQMLQSYNLIFALELLDVLSPIVIEQCYGCSVDHPSQVQHSCIMESKLSHLWMYFDLAMDKVNLGTVFEKWQKEILFLNVSVESMKMLKELIESDDWKEKHFTTISKEEICKLCENAIKVETRLNGY